MRVYENVLGPRQRQVLARVAPSLTKAGFYLGGGTALALQLGHRRSLDLDWFRPRSFDPLSLAQELRDFGIPFRTDQTARSTLHGKVQGIRVTLLEYRYPLLGAL